MGSLARQTLIDLLPASIYLVIVLCIFGVIHMVAGRVHRWTRARLAELEYQQAYLKSAEDHRQAMERHNITLERIAAALERGIGVSLAR
jgi:hypothetical protein